MASDFNSPRGDAAQVMLRPRPDQSLESACHRLDACLCLVWRGLPNLVWAVDPVQNAIMYECVRKVVGLLGKMYLGDRYTASRSFELARSWGHMNNDHLKVPEWTEITCKRSV